MYLKDSDGIKLLKYRKDATSNYAYFPVVFDGYRYSRNEIYEMLNEKGIVAMHNRSNSYKINESDKFVILRAVYPPEVNDDIVKEEE